VAGPPPGQGGGGITGGAAAGTVGLAPTDPGRTDGAGDAVGGVAGDKDQAGAVETVGVLEAAGTVGVAGAAVGAGAAGAVGVAVAGLAAPGPLAARTVAGPPVTGVRPWCCQDGPVERTGVDVGAGRGRRRPGHRDRPLAPSAAGDA